MLKIEDRDSVGRPPSAMSLSSSRSSTTKVAKNRYRSHVWHYFERDGDYAKCNVCQHNIKFNKYRSTSVFISHLEHVHLITKYTRLKDFKDFHLIPTKLAQCKNPQLCMRVRVSENFEEYGNGFWRCKNCTYTIRLKKYIAMFHHLKTEHWRPTRKSSADCTVNSEEHELDAENVSGDMNGCTEKIETDVLVEPSTSRATENLEKNGEPTTGDMEAEARPVSPIIKTRRLVNLQTAVDRKNEQSNIDLIKDCQILYDDNRRKFDHRYSKTAERNPVTSLRQTRIRKTPTSRTRPKPRSKPRSKPRATPKTEITIEQIKLRASDLHNLDIQVPLANLSPKVDVYRYRNGHTSVSYELIKTEKGGGRQNVAVITLNRPKALNALCKKLVDELNDAVTKFDKDDNVDVIVITGNETAFAAGTDVKEMQNYTYSQSFKDNFPINWDGISNARKPVIAAVNGFAFGGGFELALACDIVYAGENARFGLPEIVMGTIPGAGGTQRLTRVVGKSKAMEMILTGNHILAEEAEKCGLVSKIFPPDQLLSEAIKLGEKMSRHSQLIVSMAKESVNAAFETTLKTGLQIEKNILNGTLATTDRQEGITAFIEKRVPNFRNE